MKKIASGLFFISLLIAACKKDKEHLPINKENISGTYKLTALRMSATGVPEQDALPFMDECEKDDLYKLNPDNSFQHVDAGSVCDTRGDFEGSWELNGNQISFDGETGTITQFDGTTMVVISTSTTDGTTFNEKSTFTRQ